jgi:Tol biopolymer transport system component
VIAVGATTHTDEQASFSNFGGPLDLVAPGGGETEPATATNPEKSVLSLLAKDCEIGRVCHLDCHCAPACCADPELCDDEVCEQVCDPAPWVVGEEYVRLAGTSFAAPHVSGVAALVRSRHRAFTREQVRQVLLQSADDLGQAGWDLNSGYGRVNAQQAVAIDDMPVVEILVPENRGKIWERNFPFAVTGTVAAPGGTVQHWRLTLRREDGGTAIEIASGTAPVSHGPLGTLALASAQGLELGQRYVLQLEVEDGNGDTATDTKTFLVPNPQFAAIPVPDPFGEGGRDGTISADGRRLALARLDRNGQGGSLWLFDAKTGGCERIHNASTGRLSPDGRFLVYSSGRWLVRDLEAGLSQEIPLPQVPPASLRVSASAKRLAFTSVDLDPTIGESERSTEAFLFDMPNGPLRQVTSGPSGGVNDYEVQDLALTPDGQRLTFTSNTSLDPTVSGGGTRQVFLYDDAMKAVRQVSGRTPGDPSGGVRPSISADGGLIAFENDGLFLADVPSGKIERVLNEVGYPTVPLLASDGTKLAFAAALDLDPMVLNEDLSPEIFLLDLQTREAVQVTDTINFPYYPYDTRMDAAGNTFLVTTSGELNGLRLQPEAVRVVMRRTPNRAPNLEAPSVIVAQEGRLSRTVLTATDPDNDPITFFAQRVPPFEGGRLGDLANSELRDYADGTAELLFTPRHTESGTYPLRVAALDEAGGVDAKDVTLIIQDTQPEGDANCDGAIGPDDVPVLVDALFDPVAITQCVTVDGNDDQRVTAADLPALMGKLRE